MHRFLFFFCACWLVVPALRAQYHAEVNPMIGTAGTGHTFPGAASPFGMVQLSPDTRLEGWEGCSGYHYSDSLLYGFSHTHLSGTGCSDYGDVLLMPLQKKASDKRQLFSNSFYRTRFSHRDEKAHAGFYSVYLPEDQIEVALTTSERVGMHQYRFRKGGETRILLDLLHRDELLDARIRQVNAHTWEGFRRSKAWALDQMVYFRIETSADVRETETFSGKQGLEKTGLALVFEVKPGQTLQVKVALSLVSEEGAARNLQAEIPHWDFAKVKSENEARWDKELRRIEVKDKDPNKRTIFYTALYHSFLQPNLASDVDGRYRGRDGQIHQTAGHGYYTVFSLWDTFRSAHPLYNLVQRSRNLDFIRTFLLQYQQGGRLPVWELASNETDCMIGYHSVSVMADAWAKGIRNFDRKLAVEAAKASANREVLGLKAYHELGYIPVEAEHESVSKTLEYAYDDWCISTLMEGAGKEEFRKRSQAWKHLFDPASRVFRPRLNGGWISPFEPREVNNHFTEANAWQYGFFVPHDVPGLMAYHGGGKSLEKKLDELFTASSQTTGRTQVDITGLIGQYAHGNEPSHHIPWLYTLAGAPGKTQERVREILDRQYRNHPDGLAGNEDCGQMSAWLIMSALGIYPLCPGSDQYVLGTPWFEEMVLHLEEGKSVRISAPGAGKRKYTRALKRGGQSWKSWTVSHQDWVSAGNWTFECGEIQPERFEPATASLLEGDVLPAPRIIASRQAFRDSLQVSLESTFLLSELRYKINQGPEMEYKQAFWIRETSDLQVWATGPGKNQRSDSRAHFHRIPHNWEVSLAAEPNRQYTAGGPDGLIDGLRGDTDWRKGLWMGYQYQDFEVQLDLKSARKRKEIRVGFLQDTRAWIVLPREMEIWISADGQQYRSLGRVGHSIPVQTDSALIHELKLEVPGDEKVRFVKVVARRFGSLPDWHPGRGEPSFVFVDEIQVID